MSSTTLWYTQPASQWIEALPLGGGRLGAMVFGGVDKERIALNEDTLWSGGPREWNNPQARVVLPDVRRLIFDGQYEAADEIARQMQGPFTQSYQPLGDLKIAFEQAAASDYRRDLDLDTAIASVTYRDGDTTFTREAFCSYPDRVFVLRLSCDQPGRIRFVAALDSPLQHTVSSEGADTLVLIGRAPDDVVPDYRPADQPVRYDETSTSLSFAVLLRVVVESGGTVAAAGESLRVSGADAVTLYISAATSFTAYDNPHGQNPLDVARLAMQRAHKKTYAGLRSAHVRDHQALFRRVTLELGGADHADKPTDARVRDFDDEAGLIALLFQYGRYLLIASSRQGTQPANLQGIWNEHVRPPWSSNYTTNINTEMNYWPAESTNLAECAGPLFDMIADLSRTGLKTAQVNYGCRGWVTHHNTDLWRQTAPPGGYGEARPVWSMWPMAGVWLCQHLWEHYAFGLDEKFLRETAYPLMKGAALFCLDWLIEDGNGRLVTAPSTSPENTFTTPDGQTADVSAGATMDMALMWDLFTNCIAAAQALGEDDGFRKQLEQARERLYPAQIGQHGQLQEWAQDWDAPDDHHRHVSHLFGLHPGRQITRWGTPDLYDAARRSLELRGDESTGWSMAWKSNLWARLHDGDRAYRLLRSAINLTEEQHVTEQGGLYANLFDAHPPFQIDGNFGLTASIAEMLLQSHTGELHLLPALPSAWPEGRVSGLRARGGYTVGITWAGGQLTEATIKAGRNGRCRVRGAESVRENGATIAHESPEPGVVVFEAVMGRTYTVGRGLTGIGI